jgi:hypothetical protein
VGERCFARLAAVRPLVGTYPLRGRAYRARYNGRRAREVLRLLVAKRCLLSCTLGDRGCEAVWFWLRDTSQAC